MWDIKSGHILKGKSSYSNEHCITAIDWSPTINGEFVYADNSGQFGMVYDMSGTNEERENDIGEDRSEVGDDVDFGDSMFFMNSILRNICNLYSFCSEI